MIPGSVVREISSDGSVVLRDAQCSVIFRRPRPGALEIRVVGCDNGQFGTALVDEVAMAMVRDGALDLYIDASEASMPSVDMTKSWAHFFSLNRHSLRRVRILATSRSLILTMQIIRHLSGTADLVHVYSDRALYEARKSATA